MAERNYMDKDKLVLRGMLFHGYHGVKPEEKKLGQKFLVDLDAWADLSKAGESDDVSDTVDYDHVYRIVKGIVEGPSRNLQESVAYLVANATLLEFPQISAVRVFIRKPHIAMHGTLDCMGVEIFRYQSRQMP